LVGGDSSEAPPVPIPNTEVKLQSADGLQILLDAGVSAVVAPGGSVRDNEVIAAARSADIAMFFTGVRHFSHA